MYRDRYRSEQSFAPVAGNGEHVCRGGRPTLVSVKSAGVHMPDISKISADRGAGRILRFSGCNVRCNRVQRCKRLSGQPSDYIPLPWRRTNPPCPGRRPTSSIKRGGEEVLATTASKRQNGQECNRSPGSSTTGRFRGRRSNSAGAISAARRERSTARGRGGRVSVISVTQGSSGNGTGGRG